MTDENGEYNYSKAVGYEYPLSSETVWIDDEMQKRALQWDIACHVKISVEEIDLEDNTPSNTTIIVGDDSRKYFRQFLIQATSGGVELASAVGGSDAIYGKELSVSITKRERDLTEDISGREIVFSGNNYYNNLVYDPYYETWEGVRVSQGEDLHVTLSFSDTKTPTVTAVTAPAGTYSPGQIIPVTVTFSEPVSAEGAKVRFNGVIQDYSAAEGSGYSNVLTFPYTVQESDNATLSISYISSITDVSGHTMTAYNPGGDIQTGKEFAGINLSTPVKVHAINGVTATVENSMTDPTLEIDVSILNNDRVNFWLGNDIDPATKETQALLIKVDGGNTYPLTMKGSNVADGLTASISLPLNTGGSGITHVIELVLDGELLIGKYATATHAAAKFITEDDLSVSLSVKQSDGETDYEYADETKTIYLQENPQVSARYELTGSGYSFAGADQFEWSSSDTRVANIGQDGFITGTGAGEVYFILTAKNGGMEGREVKVTTDTLRFGVGLTPFLLIPNNNIHSVGGQPVTVFWSSNICDKNGEEDTAFTVTVTRNNSGKEPWTTPVTGTASKPAASVTIPGDVLSYDYEHNQNTFTVKVSTEYSGQTFSAEAVIALNSPPAKVNFGKLSTYYITDETKSLNIRWNITNFDQFSGNDLFELYITRGNEDVIRNTTDPGTQTEGTGEYSGSYTLDIADVVSDGGPTSYRDVYTVTIKAKNGTDSTWSYDSFLLYVYDADALKIMVDGEAANNVTMSNIAEISRMSQTQILALKRDIYLKDIISVNYGEYAWNEVADQIQWKSSDSGVASVNYQQGTLYENIENFTYVSYRPTTDLGLSGLKDGKALVTAIHKLTGMTETLDVTVETLKDKLYLFQCYPQTTTTLTYTGNDGVEHTVISDATGAAAIYDAGGIQSDVYCSAQYGGNTYMGTFYLDQLKTGEGDWTKLERYPQNNLELRRAAYAYLYVKNPDGTPYTGNITFHGGVYVNDEYKAGGLFAFADGAAASLRGDGSGQTVTLGSDGKLTIVMDQTQWDLTNNTITPQDQVNYVFEIDSGNTKYYPMLLTVKANVNQNVFVGSGEAIVNFRENTGTSKHPFIALQGVQYSNRGGMTSLLNTTGRVGLSDNLPEAFLTTTVMWWGQDMTGVTPKLQLVTGSGIAMSAKAGQYEIVERTYPFTDTVITEYTVKLNEETMNGVLAPGKTMNIYLNYYQDGKTLSRHESLSFQLTNLLGIGTAEDVKSTITDMLHNMGRFTGTDARSAKGQSFGDQFVGIALNLVSSDSYTTGEEKRFSIQLAPTSDPTKFLGFIQVNVGNMPEVQMDMGMSPASEEFDYKPGWNELMYVTGNRSAQKYLDAMAWDIYFGFSGYMESLIYYDFNAGRWQIQILNGGFNAGGGVGYTWDWNIMVGPIPFTASLTIGGTADVGLDALAVSYYNRNTGESGLATDFLTQLHIYLYLRFFAGVGFDYAVVACKLGIFGQVNVNMRFAWLNRPYMIPGVANVADGGTKEVTSGQHFRIDGQIGMEFMVRVLFISYKKVLFSYGFNMLNQSVNGWNEIQSNWEANQKAQQAAISGLLNTNTLSVTNVGGQQMLSLNLAPTLESRDYLYSAHRAWGPGISLFSLDEDNGLANLESNTYPYANPVVSDDGQLVVYLSDMGSEDVNATRAAFAAKSGNSYVKSGAIDNSGYGDSQVSLSGTGSFAVAAWTRQMVSLNKDAGATLTDTDQIMIMNGTEVWASVYTGNSWTTARLTDNGTADLAPVVASNGSKAIVAWRAVSSNIGEKIDGYTDITNFNEKDTILYRVYSDGTWEEPQTLYNGTSGSVKGIVAAMLDDGTAAVAYTLDEDKNDETIHDREIYYAVVGSNGEVFRNIRATNDGYLDENPQLTAVTFPSDSDKQRFVLGWYTKQAVASDAAAVLDAGDTSGSGKTTADNRSC